MTSVTITTNRTPATVVSTQAGGRADMMPNASNHSQKHAEVKDTCLYPSTQSPYNRNPNCVATVRASCMSPVSMVWNSPPFIADAGKRSMMKRQRTQRFITSLPSQKESTRTITPGQSLKNMVKGFPSAIKQQTSGRVSPMTAEWLPIAGENWQSVDESYRDFAMQKIVKLSFRPSFIHCFSTGVKS